MWQRERQRDEQQGSVIVSFFSLFPRRRRLVPLAPSFAVLFWRVCAGVYDTHMRNEWVFARSAHALYLQRRPAAAIAQLGKRQTEDLKVPGSIPGLGISSGYRSSAMAQAAPSLKQRPPKVKLAPEPPEILNLALRQDSVTEWLR